MEQHRVDLLWILRERCGLIGPKFGCGVGQCGACTVLLNGDPIRSCSTPLVAVESHHDRVAGRDAHPVQEAWVEMQVPQCGYRQSGLILSATALRRSSGVARRSSPRTTARGAAHERRIAEAGAGYRRALLAGRPRELAVLKAAAEAADWGGPLPEGRARAIAVDESFGSFVAEVAEVSVEGGKPRVHKFWCAIDCGTVVNPAIVQAQMESGIVFGLGAALYGEINSEDGRVVQGNFGDYPSLRIDETPEIEVILAPSGDAPGRRG